MAFNILDQAKSFLNPDTKPAARADQDFKGGFVITEVWITKDPITLALVGNAMPHVPFTWGGELRTSDIFYPGNPEPTVQIFGSKESDLSIKGRLFDKRQPKGSKPLAAEVTDVLDTIRKRGNLLKLELGPWRRWGYLTKTNFNMKRLTSIEYELTFFIVSDKEPTQNPILKGKALPTTNNEKLKDVNTRLLANIASYPSDFPKGPFDVINQQISDVAAKVAKVTSAVDNIISTAEQANATLNKAYAMVAAAKRFVFKANQRIGKILLDNEVRKASLKSSMDYSGITKAYPKVERQSVTNGYKNIKTVQTTGDLMMETMATLGFILNDLTDFLATAIARRHLVKDGETLQTIAVTYYGDAEQWTKIRDRNNLRDTQITAGKVLEIPK